jgi:hypothetical protein
VDVRLEDRDFRQQRLRGHAVVAVLVIGRHGPLVAEIDLDVRPVDPVAVRGTGQQLEQRLRCRPPRQRDRESARARDRFMRGTDDALGRLRSDGGGVGQDFDLGLHHWDGTIITADALRQ